MLTREERIKGNILISEYMGLLSSPSGHIYPVGRGWCNSDILRYHEDWNWLMAVVGKIEKEKVVLIGGDDEHTFDVWINEDGCSVEEETHNSMGTLFTERKVDGENKIDSVWRAVVKFVHWYNKNVEKK